MEHVERRQCGLLFLGLQSAMGDPFFLRRREAARDLHNGTQSPCARRSKATPHSFSKRLAFEQLGDNEWRHHHRCRCRTPPGCSGGSVPPPRGPLVLESMEAAEVGRECRGQNLDRNITSEPRIACTVDLAHAARAEQRQDLVGPRRAPGLRARLEV